MKDWELKKQNASPEYEQQWGKYYLLHHHEELGPAVVRWYGNIGWHCIRCGAVPPEEIQIVAELASIK